jgi:hypothetical protein
LPELARRGERAASGAQGLSIGVFDLISRYMP